MTLFFFFTISLIPIFFRHLFTLQVRNNHNNNKIAIEWKKLNYQIDRMNIFFKAYSIKIRAIESIWNWRHQFEKPIKTISFIYSFDDLADDWNEPLLFGIVPLKATAAQCATYV